MTDRETIYRIRPVLVDMGIRVRMYDVTSTRNRKRIGPHHISATFACYWCHKHGMRHVGGCYRALVAEEQRKP